jgi:hypothetical protein
MRMMEVQFKVHYRVDYGDELYLTGNCDHLGNWKPILAYKLTWNSVLF